MNKKDYRQLQDLQEDVGTPLDDQEIRKSLKVKKINVNLIQYADLRDYDYFPFDQLGRLVIFFAVESKYSGHWQCVLKYPSAKVIEYFDPYGIDPTKGCQEWIPEDKQIELGEDVNYAAIILKNEHDEGYKCLYNHHAFQRDDDDIQTCGRWCIVRLLFRQLTNEKFYKFIKKMEAETGLTSDALITYITTNRKIIAILK